MDPIKAPKETCAMLSTSTSKCIQLHSGHQEGYSFLWIDGIYAHVRDMSAGAVVSGVKNVNLISFPIVVVAAILRSLIFHSMNFSPHTYSQMRSSGAIMKGYVSLETGKKKSHIKW